MGAACCQDDTTKCKYIGTITCARGYYQDSSKDGDAATAANKNTVCCTAKTECYGAPASVCSAGYKKKMTYCTTSSTMVASCATCCEADATKCGTTAVPCANTA